MSARIAGLIKLPSFRTFLVLWGGQLVSLLGSSLTGFALAIWVYQRTGSVTLLSMIVVAATVPGTFLSPIVGALVDRWDRRVVMLACDAVAAATTLLMVALYFAGRLEIWQILVLTVVGCGAGSFQGLAYSATVPLLVAKQHLGRVSGLAQLGQSLAVTGSPALAGVLLQFVGIGGVLLLDLATFVVAAASLVMIRVPRPRSSDQARRARGSLKAEVAVGWRYLRQRAGLMGLLLTFTSVSFLVAFGNVLYIPLMLSFASSAALGAIVSAGGAGMVVGSLVVTARGVGSRKVLGMLALLLAGGLLMALIGLRTSVVWIGATTFAMMFILPFARAMDEVLWQTKVAPEVQGRVFSMRRMVAQGSAPIAYLLAGPLADGFFEPWLAEGGALASSVGRVLGTGQGRGIGLMFVLIGLGTALIAVAGYLHPRIRNLEAEVPDALEDRPLAGAGQPAPEPV